MLVGVGARHTVQLISCQVCIMAAVDKVVRYRIIEIYRRRGIGCVGRGRPDVFEKVVVEWRLCKLRKL